MKPLLLTLILSSLTTTAFAGWDDVYYCEMTQHHRTLLDGTTTNYKLEKFKFKIDKEKNALIISQSTPHKSFPVNSYEILHYGDLPFFVDDPILGKDIMVDAEQKRFGKILLRQKENLVKFIYAALRIGKADVITADCDKF